MPTTSDGFQQRNWLTRVRNSLIGGRPKTKTPRYWEIDMLRGMAIILMVFYHLIWDLNYLGALKLNLYSRLWQWFARGIATVFICVMGISLVLSYTRAGQTAGFQKYLRRGSKIFAIGLIITLVTYLFLGQEFVVFGVLHVIGFSIIAAYPFLPYRHRHVSLIAGVISIGLGIYLNGQVSPTPWFIWLGISQAGRSMVDYYPVLPWFGMALVGVYAGHALYPGGMPRFVLPDKSGTPVVRELSFLGRHSLFIYLIHQPILLGILILLGIGSI